MGCANIEQHSSSAREQSLLRSLSAIHRSPKYHPSHSDTGSGNRIEKSACKNSLLKRRRGGKVVPSKITRKGHRRKSLTSEVPAPTNKAVTPPFSSDEHFPTLPFPESSVDKKQPAVEHHYRGYRKDYALGEAVRSPSHMIIEPTSARAIHAARSLRNNDFAFVKRSDGSFSYAILAYRCMEPFRNSAKAKIIMEECMVFVVSSSGSNKMVRKRQSESVRLVSIDGLAVRQPARKCAPPYLAERPEENCAWIRQELSPPAPCNEISDDDWVPPKMISFVPPVDDECSLISSVSNRARGTLRR